MEYRNELKYIVSDKDLTILDYRFKNLFKLDPSAKNKIYNVRSIYFDSLDNKCFYENEAGFDERFKVRIRVYNSSYDDIKLEVKHKKNGFTKKESCLIDKSLCEKLLSGKKLEYKECQNKVLKKLYIEQRIRNFMPKIMVEYDRVAYIDKIGNIRITFDTNIRASCNLNNFFKPNTYSRPILEKNKHILEVKYDEILPSYVVKELEMIKLERTSFSKYYLSRIAFKEEIL